MAIIDVVNLSKAFGGLVAVNNVSFSVEKGEVLSVIGPNGSGKTTLFNLMTKFLNPTKGEVHLDGKDITHLPPYQIAEEGICRTFQEVRVFPQMTVLENLLAAFPYPKGKRLWNVMVARNHIDRENELYTKRALELLRLVQLEKEKDRLAENLSFGHQRLLGIARALVLNPVVLLLDEPNSGVDPTVSLELMNLIRSLQREGLTIIFSSHDLKFVMEISERIMVLNFGTQIASGTPDEIKNNPRVIEAYIGKEMGRIRGVHLS
jgi:ABC-type branched-subunit amino acid transport system ATPase component